MKLTECSKKGAIHVVFMYSMLILRLFALLHLNLTTGIKTLFPPCENTSEEEYLSCRTLFFVLFYTINNLKTFQIYPVFLQECPDPLDHQTKPAN